VNAILANYQLKCSQASDINRHLPVIYKYARQCESISEFGVRGIVSTWALLRGLIENGGQKKELFCVDIEDIPEMENVQNIARENGITVTFQRHESATCSIPEVDMLFIDTWHVYGHLKRELNNHHGRVRKYILMHDTEVDGLVGESVRMGWDLAEQARRSGYREQELRWGMQRAIAEFLAGHPDWKLLRRYHHNNGLTILARPENVRISLWNRFIAKVQNSPIYSLLRNWALRCLRKFQGRADAT
jgi:hypothetical protein